ncbi:hypothetical protein Tco_0856285 [Tanacetum coccineum]|uniref:Uncharacterized protein n=1 Tax=Tanacetum coccineum TaxID=301880 RepID=A0ABQ5B6V4_9ASTR
MRFTTINPDDLVEMDLRWNIASYKGGVFQLHKRGHLKGNAGTMEYDSRNREPIDGLCQLKETTTNAFVS